MNRRDFIKLAGIGIAGGVLYKPLELITEFNNKIEELTYNENYILNYLINLTKDDILDTFNNKIRKNYYDISNKHLISTLVFNYYLDNVYNKLKEIKSESNHPENYYLSNYDFKHRFNVNIVYPIISDDNENYYQILTRFIVDYDKVYILKLKYKNSVCVDFNNAEVLYKNSFETKHEVIQYDFKSNNSINDYFNVADIIPEDYYSYEGDVSENLLVNELIRNYRYNQILKINDFNHIKLIVDNCNKNKCIYPKDKNIDIKEISYFEDENKFNINLNYINKLMIGFEVPMFNPGDKSVYDHHKTNITLNKISDPIHICITYKYIYKNIYMNGPIGQGGVVSYKYITLV